MQKHKLLGSLMIAIALLVVSGCSEDYGKLLEFNSGELYYTSNVTADDAKGLGQYLVSSEFFDGNEKTVQLNKTGTTYEFRMVIKVGLENDQEVIQISKVFANELSADVFRGSPVDIHLCDENLETLRVVVVL